MTDMALVLTPEVVRAKCRELRRGVLIAQIEANIDYVVRRRAPAGRPSAADIIAILDEAHELNAPLWAALRKDGGT
jgi:hypothetical protein